MNKAISVAAVLALAAASNEFADHELINLHSQQPRLHRPTFSPLVRDVAHDDEQMVRLNPEIVKPHYRTFAPLVADDNDDELVYATALRMDDDEFFVDQQADDEFLIRLDPALTRPHIRNPIPIMAADDNDDEFFVEQADNELGFFKKIGDGFKKAGQFVVSHPQIITTAAKFLDDDDEFYVDQQADDELVLRPDREIGRPRPHLPPYIVADDEFYVDDDEFFVDQQADDEFLIRLDPALTRPHIRNPLPIMAADDNDDEFFVEQADNELGFFKKIGDGLKKAGQFVVSHPQIITTAAKFLDDDDEFYADQQADDELVLRPDREIGRPRPHLPPYIVADDEFYVEDDELFAFDAASIKKAQREMRANEALMKARIEKKTGAQDSLLSLGGLLKEGKRFRHVKPQEVQDNMNFLEDFQDNNLSIKDKLKGAANWIGDHPQVITEGAKIYKILKGKH